MSVKPDLLKTINEQIQKVPIAQERWPELAVEIGQLRTAAEAVAEHHQFDRNPEFFYTTLRRLSR